MGVSSTKSAKFSRLFMEALASALLEWLLLFLLLLNAIIAYAVTKLARRCGLQTPCLLCSRLDHVLGNEKSGYYWDMICDTHKLEISALAICHVHSSSGHLHDAMKIIGGRLFDHMINQGIGSLPHVGYTELKATSDTESDVFMFSDDDATGVFLNGGDGHVSLDFATLETPIVDGNVESGVEIGLKEMNWGSPEIKNDAVFIDELHLLKDFCSSRNEVVAPEKPSSETREESTEVDEVIEKAETNPIPSLEESTEEKTASIETSQEIPSIIGDRESRESDSPRQDHVTESSPKATTLSPRDESSSLHTLDTLEKNESDPPMDVELDRLKRQLEDDKRALHELQRELEEERNASAIAANEAMAMITRLQDEKANLHMEAQQYLRMMEEQAEYDMDALQKSNDLLVEREMEIQDLEDELESYRTNDALPENVNDSLLCIEDERVHLQQCLKKLEEKLIRVSSENPTLSKDGGDRQMELDSPNKSWKSGGVDSLSKEVSSLQERLEKLETDRDFIERAIKYLRIGDEGVLFIQDLASHLQDLRNHHL